MVMRDGREMGRRREGGKEGISGENGDGRRKRGTVIGELGKLKGDGLGKRKEESSYRTCGSFAGKRQKVEGE